MKFYFCPRTRAFRILWLVEEMGLPCERVLVDIRDEQARSDPEFRRASPLGKVPALVDGDTRLWDSGAIALYLADKHPDAGLGVPVGHRQRGAFLQWVMFNNAVLEPALGEKFAKVEPNSSQSGHGSFDLMIGLLETALGQGPWLLGERFTVADTLVGSGVHFMQLFGALPNSPVLAAYLDRCRARPAFGRAMEAEEAA
ncbi:MAG: glutathione S-transferase family protein [Geminicoccaceae bacterium]|nr:glutathione S-transferase family protein [Geminicoccaceae bacterium]